MNCNLEGIPAFTNETIVHPPNLWGYDFTAYSSFGSFPPTKELRPFCGSCVSIVAMEQILYETLAGRIRWEQTRSGIRVEIPTRKDWSAILAVSVVEIWALRGLSIIPERFFVSGHPNSTQWIALLGFLALGSLAFIWLLWSFAGKSRLELDPIELKIVRQIFGIKLDTRA